MNKAVDNFITKMQKEIEAIKTDIYSETLDNLSDFQQGTIYGMKLMLVKVEKALKEKRG